MPRYEQLKVRVGEDPHELADAIQDAASSSSERVRLLFEAFEDNPSYAILMYLKHEFNGASPALRAEILARYRGYLQHEDDRFADEILYTLWCDYFEDPDTVEDTWRALAGTGSAPRVLQRLLPVSGPVPWHLKKPLIEALQPARRWHPYLYKCLLASQFDYFGDINASEARRILLALEIGDDTEHFHELRKALESK